MVAQTRRMWLYVKMTWIFLYLVAMLSWKNRAFLFESDCPVGHTKGRHFLRHD